MRRVIAAVTLSVFLLLPHVAAGQVDQWTHRGSTSSRNAVVAGETAPEIITPRFIAAPPTGFQLVGQSAPVVHDGRIFVYATRTVDSVTTSHVIAFSEADGSHLWTAQVGNRSGDSWSAATLYTPRNLLLMPSGTSVTAINAATGAVVWQTSLGSNPIVNGTVLVHGTKAYVADHKPMSTGAKLYCLNLDLEHPTAADGAILWSQPLMRSVGSEAALAPTAAGDRVVVTDMAGYIRQFDTAGNVGWTFALPGAGSYLPNGGFNGGLSVEGQQAFAATYNFYGASLLVCLNTATGQQIWSTSCERSDTLPIVTADTVYLSGGVVGYGSQPKVEAFNRATGAKRWQWTTAGGWTMQPVLVGQTLYVGDGAGVNPGTPASNFYALDLSKTPTDAGFVKGHYVGCGSSPASANGNVYTIGAAGLHAFGPPLGGAGPQVTGWSSVASHGAGGEVGLAMVAGYVEPRTSGLRMIRLTFDQPLDPATVNASAVAIRDLDLPAPGTVDTSAATATLSGDGLTLTFTLPAALTDGHRYELAAGPQLKGADGAAAAGSLTVAALAGDVNGDRRVDAADVLAVRAAMATEATANGERVDVDGSGLVTAQDMRTVRGRSGRALAE